MGHPFDFRSALEKMTFEQLKKEADHFYLNNVPDDRASIIDAIMSHLGRITSVNNQREEENHQIEETTDQAEPVTKSTNKQTLEEILLSLIPLISSIVKQMQEKKQLLQQILQAVTAGTTSAALVQNDTNTTTVSDKCFETGKFSHQSFIETANAVNVLSPLIPEFGGTEEENVKLWIQRIDEVYKIYEVPDNIIFLVAINKLVNLARYWFDFGSGPMIKSWADFKEAVIKRFNGRDFFILQKIEARKWNYLEESFQEYAMDCLPLINSINLTPKQAIKSLIDGIKLKYIQNRARVISQNINSIGEFLNKMNIITNDSISQDKYDLPIIKSTKLTEQKSDNSRKADHFLNSLPFYNHCSTRDHCQLDCSKLKKKDMQHSQSTPSPIVLKLHTHPASYTMVREDSIYSMTSCLKIIKFNGYKCCLYAGVRTGNLVSFIRPDVYKKFYGSSFELINSPNFLHEGISFSNQFNSIYGFKKATICCEQIPTVNFDVNLYVLDSDVVSSNDKMDILLGNDFLEKNDVVIKFDNSKSKQMKESKKDPKIQIIV